MSDNIAIQIGFVMILQYYNCEWKQLNFWGTWNSLKNIMVAFTLLECAFKILFFFFFGQNFSHLLQLHVSSTEERIKGLSLCNLTHEDWNHSQDSFLHPFKKKFCGLFQWRKIVDKKQVSLMWSQLSKKRYMKSYLCELLKSSKRELLYWH